MRMFGFLILALIGSCMQAPAWGDSSPSWASGTYESGATNNLHKLTFTHAAVTYDVWLVQPGSPSVAHYHFDLLPAGRGVGSYAVKQGVHACGTAEVSSIQIDVVGARFNDGHKIALSRASMRDTSVFLTDLQHLAASNRAIGANQKIRLSFPGMPRCSVSKVV